MKSVNERWRMLLDQLNQGCWCDGDALGAQLGVSRTAVWKMLQRLKRYGLPLEARQGQGYRLLEPVTLLDRQRMSHMLGRADVAWQVLEHTTSTTHVLQLDSAATWSVCMAETQSAGMGRLGRSWYAPFGLNVYLSLGRCWPRDLSRLPCWGLVSCLAVRSALQAFTKDVVVGVKWPNDWVVAGAKLGGVRVDVQGEAHGATQVLVGVGLNVNMTEVPSSAIDQPWTSLELLLGHPTDRNALSVALVEALTTALETYVSEGWEAFAHAWETADVCQGRQLTVHQPDGSTLVGKACGVDHVGRLRVLEASGKLHHVASGDVIEDASQTV